MPRHTAKFHLDKLVEEGLLDTEFQRLSGRRRPGRRATDQAVPAVGAGGGGHPARTPLRPGRPADGRRPSTSPPRPAGPTSSPSCTAAAAQHGGTLGRGSDPRTGARTSRTRRLAAVGADARRARVRAAPWTATPHAGELPLPRPGPGPHRARLRDEPRAVGPGRRPGVRALTAPARPGRRTAAAWCCRPTTPAASSSTPACGPRPTARGRGAPRFDNDRREREELSTPPVTKPGSGAIVVMSALLVVGQGRARCGRRRTGQGRACCCRLLLGHYVEARARWTPARPTNRLEGSLLAPVINGVRPGGRAIAIQHPCHYSCVRGRTRCNSGDAFTAGVMTYRARPADDESGKSRAGR